MGFQESEDAMRNLTHNYEEEKARSRRVDDFLNQIYQEKNGYS